MNEPEKELEQERTVMNCECQEWARANIGGTYNIRRRDGVPLVTNHHEKCPRYNDSLMDVWVCNNLHFDNEKSANEFSTEGRCGPVIGPIKMHREIFENLSEFEGF